MTVPARFAAAEAKLYVGNKADNIRIQLKGNVALIQGWKDDKEDTEVAREEFKTAKDLTDLIKSARNEVNAPDGQIRVVSDDASIIVIDLGTEAEEIRSFGKSGAKLLDALITLAKAEEIEGEAARGQLADKLAEALAKPESDQGETAVETVAGKLTTAPATGTDLVGTPLNSPVQGAGIDLKQEADAQGDELGLVETMEEQFQHPGLVHRFGFPAGITLGGAVDVTLPDGSVTEHYTFSDMDGDPADDSAEGTVVVEVRTYATDADEEAEDDRISLELPTLTAINRLLNLIETYGDELKFNMVSVLTLDVPALELEYRYTPEKGKLTSKIRVEFAEAFIADLSAIAVPTYTPFDLRMHGEFSYEDFAHVTSNYAASLSARCRNSSPASVLTGKIELIGWASLTDDAGESSTLMFDGASASNSQGDEVTMQVAVAQLLAADKITFFPDTRLMKIAKASTAKDKSFGPEALTGMAVKLNGKDEGIIYTTKGLGTLLNNFHQTQVAAVTEEVKKVNELVDTELSIVLSELMVDLPQDVPEKKIKSVQTKPRIIK
ncbi:hypothetical protein KoPa5_00063 [Pseudomonas phage vB_PpuM-KoPa-5]